MYLVKEAVQQLQRCRNRPTCVASRWACGLELWSSLDHIMVMITVSTAELKARLGRYLRMVRGGESVQVTSHRHPVARLVPATPESQQDTIPPTRPVRDLAGVAAVPLKKPVDALGILLEDRRRR